MPDLVNIYRRKSFVLIFTYAPIGFGHLRVTDALYHGLPGEITPILLGSQDQSISNIYRFVSIHPISRLLMEWTQRGFGEDIFAYFYKSYLKLHSKLLYQQLITILEQRIDIPENIIVVATHFGIAHQLSSIKHKIEKERNVKIELIVQVTDDSPQKLWYVPEADIIFTPSNYTAKELHKYATTVKLPYVNIIVNPYPINPLLVKLLSHEDHQRRIEQLNPNGHSYIHVVNPISGAAVGMNYYANIIRILTDENKRFKFHVIAKSAPYTQNFLQKILSWPSVDLHVSVADREVVNMYEKVYLDEIIGLEITKPSEQAFKSLINPRRRGGTLLLFSEPVGRQEYDNLSFLQRHKLIPQKHEVLKMWDKSDRNMPLSNNDSLLDNAISWRGLMLPSNSKKAAQFILWALRYNLLFQMVFKREVLEETSELSPFGVQYFWNSISQYLQNQ